MKCVNDSNDKVLSHAFGKLFMVDNLGGEGEQFKIVFNEF